MSPPAPQHDAHPREEWVKAFGEVVYHFGQLEWVSHWAYRWATQQVPSRRFGGCSFEKRNAKALTLLEARLSTLGKPELAQRWRDFFEGLRAASGRRSDVVHNPLSVDFFEDADGEFRIRQAVELLREDGNTMRLEEVEAVVNELRGLSGDMLRLLNDTSRAVSEPPPPHARCDCPLC